MLYLDRIVIASHNEGKVSEFRTLLAPLQTQVLSARELQLEEPEETGTTFEENALLKARSATAICQLPVLADDSGLSVAALDGDPGIYSARWAGPGKDFYGAMERIRDELLKRDVTPQGSKASFVCALALAMPDGYSHTFSGEVRGHLTFPPRGAHGFGYDPIFVPEGHDETFAEMDADAKHRLSHRAKALASLLHFLKETA